MYVCMCLFVWIYVYVDGWIYVKPLNQWSNIYKIIKYLS